VAVATEWVLLAYRLPREPSGPRVTLWRKLRALGAVQLVDGLVALPASGQNRERFDWLADEILDADGEAWTFVATPGSKAEQRALATRLADAATEECRALLEETEAVLASGDRPHRRTVNRLQRELRRVEDGDAVPAKERVKVRRAVERLTAVLESVDQEAPR
jgi:hypothetical protein